MKTSFCIVCDTWFYWAKYFIWVNLSFYLKLSHKFIKFVYKISSIHTWDKPWILNNTASNLHFFVLFVFILLCIWQMFGTGDMPFCFHQHKKGRKLYLRDFERSKKLLLAEQSYSWIKVWFNSTENWQLLPLVKHTEVHVTVTRISIVV